MYYILQFPLINFDIKKCNIIHNTFSFIFSNPSQSQILGLHFDLASKSDLKYLNVNTTYNTTIKQNYRQMESAFWSEYLPTVIGIIVPTYPPTTEVS